MSFITREIKRVAARAFHSYEGFKITWVDEKSFSHWVVLNGFSILATFLIEMSRAEQMIIIGFGLLVLIMELVNTGIEAAIDRISEEIHPLSKKAKDVACAAVFLTAITLGIMWLIVLLG